MTSKLITTLLPKKNLITEITNETDTVKHKITSTRNWDISGEIQLPHKDSVFRYILTEELSKEYIPNILKVAEIELN